MKDKIIVDGIDVSECEFYNDVECNAYRQEYWEPQDNTRDLCKEHPICYFKELQREKAMNKRIVKDLAKFDEVLFLYGKLKEENDYLRQKNGIPLKQ